MLKPGDIAVMKTTEEMVFVLAIEPQLNPSWPELSGTDVVVRRPIQTAERGLYYAVERFMLDELETPEDKTRRSAREYTAFKKIAEEETKALKAANDNFTPKDLLN